MSKCPTSALFRLKHGAGGVKSVCKTVQSSCKGPPNGKKVVNCECNLMECVDYYTPRAEGSNSMCYLAVL
ncbi:unnamed protein product [Sphenostylis stenocarpa]|uniref:Uncharacterized protein n=1 Tax=Sphenostylis stenocarpa TaxID=92480 RepID=A0AA86SU24_9FABA|nr:unnamed protein product [Sphenostylis stenocarpa]